MSTSSTSAQASSNNAASLPRLGPTWRSRGYPPPPAVPSDPRDENYHKQLSRSRSGSSSSLGEKGSSNGGNNSNSFSAFLQLDGGGSDDEIGTNGLNGPTNKHHYPESEENNSSRRLPSTGYKSRSDAFLGSGTRIGGFSSSRNSSTLSSGTFKGTGRSLADLAARAPSGGISRGHSGGYRGSEGGFRERLGNDDADKKIIRYTRERLLSMRPQPNDSEGMPSHMKHLLSTSIVSKTPQDPVCFDDFDADEIWAQTAPPRRGSSTTSSNIKTNASNISSPMSLRGLAEGSLRARSDIDALGSSSGGGRWQRGVALPPTSDNGDGMKRPMGSKRGEDAENPEDLWDDPIDVNNSAAADLSQFGTLLDDETGSPLGRGRSRTGSVGSSGSGPGGMFDLAEMSEAAKKFESELHGNKQRRSSFASTSENSDGLGSNLGQRIDPKRPLSFAGTTIRSGSGDDVNVFEDFGAPAEAKTIPGVDESKSESEENASSRLMKMIGVEGSSNNDDATKSKLMSSWGALKVENEGENKQPLIDSVVSGGSISGFATSSLSSSVPNNPWGNPIHITNNDPVSLIDGMDQNAATMKAAEEQKRQEANAAEEEKKRQATIQAQLAAQQQAAQAEVQRQQTSNHNAGRTQYNTQVEQILMERISNVLEGAWGRTDLGSLLSTLHSEDPRVVPLLGSIDDLRLLISRHSNRVAIVNGPGFGVEMAVLVMTNAQFQQHQMQKQQEEEFQMQRQLMEKMRVMKIAEEEARAREKAATMAAERKNIEITNDPWFYADPQGNIQGPFKGEEMRQWLDAGYFKGDLPISQKPNGPFHTLTSLFPDPSVAFQPPPMKHITAEDESEHSGTIAKEEEEKAKAREAMMAAEREKEEAERKANEEKLRKEKEIAEAEELAAKLAKQLEENPIESSDPNSSSAQLKMLLGLNSSTTHQTQSNESTNIIVASVPEQKSTNTQQHIESNDIATPNLPVTETPKNAQPQQSTQRKNIPVTNNSAPAPSPTANPAPAPVPAQPAWGGAASAAKAGRKKSMSEIQREEARVAARLAKQNQRLGRSSSGGWANVAASGGGGTGWTSGAVKAVRQTTVVAPVQAGTPGGVNYGTAQVRSKQVAKVGATGQSISLSKPASQQPKPSVIEDFGESAKMSPALESWCKDQMRKLNGSDDLTLIAFCMTLSDPVEIRQYLTAYLGSSSQVGNFATEFINRKGGSKPKQEEWESAGNAKKGRKKKTAAK